jgi:hypothetical protein
MMIFQVEFIDKPFVLWHSPESCRLEEKSHEPRLGEMFETRCWPKKLFSALTDTHQSRCRRARRRHNNGDRETDFVQSAKP